MDAYCAGIFVDDILDAVPIDKWFEMFKPGAAGEGGFIRVHMSFSEGDPSESRDPSPTETLAPTGITLAHDFARTTQPDRPSCSCLHLCLTALTQYHSAGSCPL